MLIVNADDLGRCPLATDRIMACVEANRVTAASAMVFMEDSERAAVMAKSSELDVGLHINFTESFTAPNVPNPVREKQDRIGKFLRRSKYALLLYNPVLRGAFREVLRAQVTEFERLYGQSPDRFDGHQHMHLCTNVLLDGLIPVGTRVRRNFSFGAGEKSLINRRYRKVVDQLLQRRHQVTDYFFALSQHLEPSQLRRVNVAAKTGTVELMAHPELGDEYRVLLSDSFVDAVRGRQSLDFERQEEVQPAELLW